MGGENNKDWAKVKDCPQTFVSGEGNTTVASRSIASSNENIIKVLGRVGFTLRDRILITNFQSVPGRRTHWRLLYPTTFPIYRTCLLQYIGLPRRFGKLWVLCGLPMGIS